MLGRLTSEINASLNLDTVLKCVAEGARELCGSDVVGIALRESGSDAMVFRFWSGGHGVNNAPSGWVRGPASRPGCWRRGGRCGL